MTSIYLDNNATTPMLPEVWEAMAPFFADRFANPASSHRAGQSARQALENARETTASLLGATADEVVFTSGATEANNLAIFGAVPTMAHIVSSRIEHPCVIEPLQQLAASGCTLDLLPVHTSGIIDTEKLSQMLRLETRLVAVMLANHETGAIQLLRSIAEMLADSPGVHLHCDAAAAAGKMAISFRDLGVTSLTISAHKFHGPKGVGALLVRRGVRLRPLLWGGHQQHGRRPGTEPVPLAVGLARALELAMQELAARREKVASLRQRLLQGLEATAAPIVVNGPRSDGLPHTLNVSFPGSRADVLLMNLDLAGIACATGSACSSGSLLPSPVLQAMGIHGEVLHSALRFSFSHLLEIRDIDEAVKRIGSVVKRLRASDS